MKVFSMYNPHVNAAGVQQAHPNVGIYPWIPNKQTSPSGPQRLITPLERGATFTYKRPGVPSASNGCGCNPAALEDGHK